MPVFHSGGEPMDMFGVSCTFKLMLLDVEHLVCWAFSLCYKSFICSCDAAARYMM